MVIIVTMMKELLLLNSNSIAEIVKTISLLELKQQKIHLGKRISCLTLRQHQIHLGNLMSCLIILLQRFYCIRIIESIVKRSSF